MKQTDDSDRVAMVSMTGEAHVGFKVDDISVNFQYGISSVDIVEGGQTTGTGVVDTEGSMATVSSGIGVGMAQLETRDSVRYRAGHECQCAVSILFGAPETGVNQFRTDFNNFLTSAYNVHTHPTAPTGPVSAPSLPGSASTADISAAKVEEVKLS